MKLFIKAAISTAALTGLTLGAFAENLSVNQLPQSVQNVIKTETKNGPVRQVQQLTRNGKTVYQVGFQGATGEKVIYLNPDGTYYTENTATVSNTPDAARLGRGRILEMKVDQLPEAVQRVVRTETANGPVQLVQQMPHNGRTVYKVSFKKSDGATKVVFFNPDGTYVNDAALAASQTAVGAPAGGTSGKRVSLSDATKVTYNQLPPAVQRTLSRFADKSAVEDIDKGMLNGQTVYQAAFKQNGQTVELRVDESGKVVRDAEDRLIRQNRGTK